MTIFPRLKGGLGNQMFQIAAACGLARKFDCKWACPTNQWGGCGQGCKPDVYRDNLYRKIPFIPTNDAVKIKERHFRHHEVELSRETKKDLILDGYWQTSKYWSHCTAEVRDLFDTSWLKHNPINTFRQNTEKPLCAVHYRGGDYKLFSEKHYVCTGTYFQEIINEVSPLFHTVLFTDDHAGALDEGIFCDSIFEPTYDRVELLAMASCDALIMPNSSFSWWAAFLGDIRTVYAPNRWFNHQGPQDFNDIFLEHWEIRKV